MSQGFPQLFISLYIDEDVTSELAPALQRRGYITESTLEANNLELSDEVQLQYATEKGLTILTYNGQDFIPIAKQWYFDERAHAGIIISKQFDRYHFGELLRQVLNLLDKLTAEDIYNQIVFLQEFKA